METNNLPKRYLNIDEVAAYIGFSKRSIHRLIETRSIPFCKPGGLGGLRFDIKAIDKWMEKQSVPAMARAV